MTRINKINRCKDCNHRVISLQPFIHFYVNKCEIEDEKLKNLDEIPGWCPLEEYDDRAVIKEGDLVKAFDHTLYEDDVSTPLDVTMKLAKVVNIDEDDFGRKVADLKFEHKNKVSRSHFVSGLVKEQKNRRDENE